MKKEGLLSKSSQVVLLSYYVGKVLHYISFAYVLFYILSSGEMRGLYRGVYSISFLLANLELNEAVICYFPRFKREERPYFLGWLVLVHSLIFFSILLGVLGYCFFALDEGGKSKVFLYGGLILSLGYVVQMAKLLKSWAIVHRKLVVPNILQNILIEILMLLFFYTYYLGYISFEQMLHCMFFPYAAHLFLMIFYLKFQGDLRIRWPNLDVIDREFRRSFLIYSFFVVLSGRLLIILMRIDIFLLGWYWGDGEVAIYTDVLNIILLLDIPVKVGRQVIAPMLRKAFADENFLEIKSFYGRVTQQQFILSGSVFMGLYYHLSYLLSDERLFWGKWLFLIIGLGNILRNIFNTSHILLVMSPFFRSTGYLAFFFVPILFLNLISIKLGGLYGIAWGMMLGKILIGSMTCYLVWSKMSLHLFSRELLFLFFLFSFCIVLEPFILPSYFYGVGWLVRASFPFLFYGVGFFLDKKA